MPTPNQDAASIWDMVRAIRDLQTFTAGVSYEEYAINLMLQRAVERQLEILGEAARRLSTDFCQTHPSIDWAGIIGLRHIWPTVMTKFAAIASGMCSKRNYHLFLVN